MLNKKIFDVEVGNFGTKRCDMDRKKLIHAQKLKVL